MKIDISVVSTEMRDAVTAHEALLADVEAQMKAVREQLEADDTALDDVLKLDEECGALERKRDAIAARLERLRRQAAQERVRELQHRLNTQWEPLAERKLLIIGELEKAVKEAARLLGELDTIDNEQRELLSAARGVNPNQSSNWVSNHLNHKRQRLGWIMHATGILREFPGVYGNGATDPWASESLSLQGRLY